MQIECKPLFEDTRFPQLITPKSGQGDSAALADWAGAEPAQLRALLLEHGALLFRGFGIPHPDALEAFNVAAGFGHLPYGRCGSPRHLVKGHVYTATDLKNIYPIPLHNEMSYTRTFPDAISFACSEPPKSGGETPLADMSLVLERIPEAIRSEFKDKQILYVQDVPEKVTRLVPKSWPQMFDTTDRAVVDAACEKQGIEATWKADGGVRLKSVCPAIVNHPKTKRPLWFNQAHVYHPSFAEELWRIGLRGMAIGAAALEFAARRFPDAGLYPHRTCFGDGSTICRRTMHIIRDAIWQETRQFSWQRGDMLLIDNLQLAHGRTPFRGRRSVLASLLVEPN